MAVSKRIPAAGAPGRARKPAVPTRVELRWERLPALEFQRDERAALPRKPGGGIDYTRVTAGAPEPIRSRLGRNIFTSAFPYPQWLQGTGHRAWQDYRLVDLDNDRWRLTVCPELGGRILGLMDKQLGRELLWQPPAFQFASVGLPGAWLLGGLEFNAFRFGHSVHGMMAVRTERVRLAGGVTGLRWGAVDELLECEWSVVVALLADRVAVQVTLRNHSQRPQPGYWWTNIAVPAQQGTRLFYHPGPVLHHAFDMGLVYERWPRLNGNDWQYWQNHSGIISAYWPEYASDVFGYAPRDEGWAMVHQADRRACRGRKLWSVGSGHDADVWMDRAGEPCAESYCEIQSGRLPTQLEADLLPPGAKLTWVESFATVRCPEAEAAGTAFRDFERAAARLSRTRETDEFWRVTRAETLVEDDDRVALSRKAVLAPASLTAREIEQATRSGWVGGAAWVRVLEQTPASSWRNLALGAARLDLNEGNGTALLAPLARAGGECGGWASLLLGVAAHQNGQLRPAANHLRNAVTRLPDNLDARRWLHQVLLESNRHHAARRLWPAPAPGQQSRSARPTAAGSDVARYARAQVAFLDGCWQAARTELEAPMPCIAEGAAGPWLLRREIDLAEAFQHQRLGRFEAAQNRLMEACRLMPQFGVGRYETTGNIDLMFYRWWLARRADARLQADALASHLLRYRPYAGSVEAAYLLRLAKALKDSSVPARAAAIAAWEADAEPVWRKMLPLRLAVRRGSMAGWLALQDHQLYRYRARFELALA